MKVASTPHTTDLFQVEDSVKLEEDERQRFHSAVQSCLYLSIRTRPDIICAVNHLTSRVTKATERDKLKLIRIMQYLNGAVELGILLGANAEGQLDLVAYADAAYGVHPDARSQTGLFITLGRGPLIWKAIKQRCVTKSSCEAEIIALSDVVSLVIWVRDLLKSIGLHDGKPVVIKEDNKAAIDMVNDGATTSDRAKHVHIRNNFIGQFIDSKDIDVEYCPTKEMVADIYTKPLPKAQFVYLRDYLLGYKIP